MLEQVIASAVEWNNPMGIAQGYNILGIIYFLGGDLDRMRAMQRVSLPITEESGDRMLLILAHGFLAWAESRKGEHEAAQASLARSSEWAQQFGGQVFLSSWLEAGRAEIALNAGRPDEALALAQKVLAPDRPAPGLFAEGVARRVWGLALAALDPPDLPAAEAQLAQSLRCLEQGAAWLEAARTHLAWARLCLARGDHAAAHPHLAYAESRFKTANLTGELAETRRLLAS
jgi:ATP/maltotriose-dependent transcriptional regulator MalT